MITCSNCNIQYVGQTKKQVRYRVYGHRNSCKNKSEQILYKHFNSECKFEHAQFRIIERTEESELLSREDYWIKKVMSLYPFGLNDQITGVGNMTRQNLVDFNFADPFYQYPERRRLRGYGNRNNRNKKVNYNIPEIISNLKSIYNQMGLKKFVDAIKGTTKKLLLMILQKVLENKNKFERRFVDILSVCVGCSRQYSKESKSYSDSLTHSFGSRAMRPLAATTKPRHVSRSSAASCQLSTLGVISWTSLLMLSDHRIRGLPTGRVPCTAPFITIFGTRSSFILVQCPAHCRRLDLTISCMYGWPVKFRMSALCLLCHWLVSASYIGPVILRSIPFSKTSSFLILSLVRVHVSQPYSTVGLIMML